MKRFKSPKALKATAVATLFVALIAGVWLATEEPVEAIGPPPNCSSLCQ